MSSLSCSESTPEAKANEVSPFDNYLMDNLPVQMSKAFGISGFAFHNAAETQSLTKPDCSKFHTMEHVFPSVTHSHPRTHA